MTTLPLSYCYGLSVLHTHLAVGASVVLTARSVTDSVLWQQMSRAGVTTLSAVPHTFDLLTAAGRSPGQLLAMRQVTKQVAASTRRRPRVGHRGHDEGWDLRLMYGQTEATGPHLGLRPERSSASPRSGWSPHCPHPGGTAHRGSRGASGRGGRSMFRAEESCSAMLSPRPTRHSGPPSPISPLVIWRDATRWHPGVLGRGSDFVKIAGLRIDLAWLEGGLARRGVTASSPQAPTICMPWSKIDRPSTWGDPSRHRRNGRPPAASDPASSSRRRSSNRQRQAGSCHRARPLRWIPVASDAPRRRDIGGFGSHGSSQPRSRADASASRRLKAVTEIYASCLGVADVRPDASFVALHGDSLSLCRSLRATGAGARSGAEGLAAPERVRTASGRRTRRPRAGSRRWTRPSSCARWPLC